MKQMNILKLAYLRLFNQRPRHGHGQLSFKQSMKFWCGKLILLYGFPVIRYATNSRDIKPSTSTGNRRHVRPIVCCSRVTSAVNRDTHSSLFVLFTVPYLPLVSDSAVSAQ